MVHRQPPFLICKSATSTPVVETSNALSWAHQLACVKDLTQCLLVKQVLKVGDAVILSATVLTAKV